MLTLITFILDLQSLPPLLVQPSALSVVITVSTVPMQPIANLGKLQRGEAYGHIVVSIFPFYLQPLVSRKDPDHLPLPALQGIVPNAAIHPRPAGSRPCVAVLVDQVVGLVLHGAETVHQLPGSVAVEAREVDALPSQAVGGGSHGQTHEGPAVGPAQLQQGVVKVHADLLGTLDPALGDASALDPDPAYQGLLGRGLSPWPGAVDGGRGQKANSQLAGPFDIIFSIVHTVGSCEDVPLGHEDPGAASGDPDGRGERVVQQEVVAADVKTAVRPVDLPLLTSVSHGNSPSSTGRRLDRTDGALPFLVFILHIHCSKGAGSVGVQRLKCQFLCEMFSVPALLSPVEAASVAVCGEVQLSVSTEARAGQRHGGMGHQRGEVGMVLGRGRRGPG